MDAQELLSRIKQQDKEAFRRLVTEYGKGLYLRLYGASGDADAAVEALLAGELDYNPNVRCDHHDHHDAGHTCGDHGCGSGHCGGHH